MRINMVKATRKDQGNCEACGNPITKGMPYKWIKPRYGGKRKRHQDCRTWRASEMTSSDKLSQLYAIQEIIEATDFATPQDVADALREGAENARSVGEEYRESAQNIEDGFGHRTQACDDIEEKADACDEWADELESAADDIEGDGVVCVECGNDESDDPHHDFEEKVVLLPDDTEGCKHCDMDEDKHHEYEPDVEDARTKASDVLYNLSL